MWSRRRPVWVGLLSAALLAPLLTVPPAAAAPNGSAAPDLSQRSVPVSPVSVKAEPPPAMPADRSTPVVWPSAGVAEVALPTAANGLRRLPGKAEAGGLPVSVAPVNGGQRADLAETPARVRVEVLDRKVTQQAGYPLAVRLSRADGGTKSARARLELTYAGFRDAYGGNWASRLGLVVLPDCALTAPSGSCPAPTRLTASNDQNTGVLSADVDLLAATGGALVALAGTPSSDTGDFTRSDLGPTATWTAGGSAANFTYSYPVPAPPAPGGLVPEISFDYDSGSVDGRTAAANEQPSWLGEGWNYHPGFIERSYRPCKDDVQPYAPYWTQVNAVSDPCWRTDNARISWNGRSTELIYLGPGQYKLADDDAEKVELLSDSNTNITGWWHNERWRITTTDGTQYYFGQSVVPGGTAKTESVLGVNVMSNHQDEPCFVANGDFKDSFCGMAWRWQLDYVVDKYGNSMLYYYKTEQNSQRVLGTSTSIRSYDRASTLSRIEYGLRKGSEASTTAPVKIVFVEANRCVTTSCGTKDRTNWPDTPWDLECATSPCGPPTFWTTKRLKGIQVHTLTGANNTYQYADIYDVFHDFPATGNATSPALWVAGIRRTGKGSGGQLGVPDLTFAGLRYEQRADYNPSGGMVQPRRYRITDIETEAGGRILIKYKDKDPGCAFGTPFPDEDQNTKRCFPQYIYPATGNPGWSWWHKYVVETVTERDPVGGAPDVVHAYTYDTNGSSTNVLWKHDDDAWSSPKTYRSWSQWAGYATVTETVGSSGNQSQTTSLYFRALQGDRTDAGQRKRVATVTNSLGEATPDYLERGGFLHERISYATPGGQALTKTIWDPWRHETSVRVLSELFADPAYGWSYIERTARQRDFTWLPASSTWRQTETVNTWNTADGTLTSVDDKGDTSTTADDRCTRAWYSQNLGTPYLRGLTNRTQTVGVACAATPTYPGDAVSDTRVFFDGSTTHGATPALGNVTRTEQAASYSGSTPTYQMTATATYDDLGRVRTTGDALGRVTATDYVETQGLTSRVATYTPAPQLHDTTAVLDPQRGLPLSVTDVNDKVTTGTYDPLGRLLTVKLPGNTTSTPDTQYVYSLTKTPASYVQTKVLGPNGNQISSFDILDGLLRPRQSQVTAPDGKRTITDTTYDARGLVAKTSAFYNDGSGPDKTRVTAEDTAVDTQHRFSYDGLGRPTVDALWSLNALKWQTTTAYGGDRVSIDPPVGGTPTTSIMDARGRQTALWQHTGADPSTGHEDTAYVYNDSDQLIRVTDAATNKWEYTYDLLGRRTQTKDPDAGTASSTYDAAGQVITSSDGRGEVLWRKYDTQGRQVELRDDSATGFLRASWTYDTLAKGQLTSSTRFDGSNAYTFAVTSYDDGYRPLGSSVTIPAAETGLAGTYTTSATYHVDGSPATTKAPLKGGATVGGLPDETLTYAYNAAGVPTTLVAGATTYVSGTSYHYDGQIAQRLLGAGAKRVRVSSTVDAATRRLGTSTVETETATAGTFAEKSQTSYGYDQAGNVLSMAGETNNVVDQVECFRYDHQRRMTDAWTIASGACANPTRGGTVDPYRLNWTYDLTGNRKTQTSHSATGTTTATATYPASGPTAVRPHAPTSIAYTGQTVRTDSYGYNGGGYTTTRPVNGVTQTLTWDAEGRLASTSQTGLSTSYVYDANGSRLLRRDNTGTTLYLGETELKRKTSGQVDGTRYYSHGGVVAVRTITGLTWIIPDHHATNQITIDPTTLAMTRRRTLPFGEVRGTPPATWPGERGFVGGTIDPTGLTHLGAREYDPALGRFISVDPVFDLADPQSWNGYAYSNNNPAAFSDPSGLSLEDSEGRSARAEKRRLVTKYSTPSSHCSGASYYSAACGGPKGKHAPKLGSLMGVHGKTKRPVTKTPPAPRPQKGSCGSLTVSRMCEITQTYKSTQSQSSILGCLGASLGASICITVRLYNQGGNSKGSKPGVSTGPGQDEEGGGGYRPAPVPGLDHTGKLHGPLPPGNHVPPEWTAEDLEALEEDLVISIKRRHEVNQDLGLDEIHARRVNDEIALLREVRNILDGT